LYRKKKGSRRRNISVSFVATFSILAGLYAAFYVSAITPRIEIQHLPSHLPSYSSFWAKYVPSGVVQFGYQNYTKIHLLNSSYPFQAKLLQLVKPVESISTPDVDHFLTIVFGQPNATVDIAFLNPLSYLSFQAPLLAQVGFGEKMGNATLYNMLVLANGRQTLGWLALRPNDDAVAFAAGTNPSKQAIQLSLESAASPSTRSMLARTDIGQSLYIVGGISDHVALGMTNFPSVVKSGLSTLTSVDSAGPYLYVKYVVAFANSTASLAHYSDVRQGYQGAQTLVVYDSYVLAREQDPMSVLGADYRLVL
jgi:hypothetical protein